MSYLVKSILFWIFAVVFTLAIATYQKMTGPTYPKKGSITIADKEVKYKLLRTNSSSSNAVITIENKFKLYTGSIVFKRLNSMDDWTVVQMMQNGDNLEGSLPAQPPAGKIEYRVFLKLGSDDYALTLDAVVIRFKGDVPLYILIPHVLFMFLAMLFSTRTGIEALIKGKYTYQYALVTVITLFFGGIILGPIVQKYAFGAYWTGWPIGKDLTDNKTAVAFIFWVIAAFKLYKDRNKKTFAIIAMAVLLAIYMIPHSMFGSQLDYKSGQVTTGKK
ncbi:MAG: hypothetical protein NTZ33_09860 [Bacteroidetes bacterium]|nr:hypothetical protein [Bacteroidota bacterium]